MKLLHPLLSPSNDNTKFFKMSETVMFECHEVWNRWREASSMRHNLLFVTLCNKCSCVLCLYFGTGANKHWCCIMLKPAFVVDPDLPTILLVWQWTLPFHLSRVYSRGESMGLNFPLLWPFFVQFCVLIKGMTPTHWSTFSPDFSERRWGVGKIWGKST